VRLAPRWLARTQPRASLATPPRPRHTTSLDTALPHPATHRSFNSGEERETNRRERRTEERDVPLDYNERKKERGRRNKKGRKKERKNEMKE
jgi:hypothetical protein